jgi:hypothetical protein
MSLDDIEIDNLLGELFDNITKPNVIEPLDNQPIQSNTNNVTSNSVKPISESIVGDFLSTKPGDPNGFSEPIIAKGAQDAKYGKKNEGIRENESLGIILKSSTSTNDNIFKYTYLNVDSAMNKLSSINKIDYIGDKTISEMKIKSIELVQCSIPVTNYNFSEQHQNNKFSIDISENKYNIIIDDGFYLPDDLSNEIEYKLNKEIYDLYNNESQANELQNEINKSNYTNTSNIKCFKVFYNKVKQRFIIGNTFESFIISNTITDNFMNDIGFTLDTNTNIDISLNSNQLDKHVISYVDYNKHWLTPFNSSSSVYSLKTGHPPKLLGPRVIYMKLNSNVGGYKLNNLKTSINGVNGDDNYFAKIPITNLSYAEIQDSNKGYLNNMTIIETEESYNYIQFNFMYHNGNTPTPIDFFNNYYNFTLKIGYYDIKSDT